MGRPSLSLRPWKHTCFALLPVQMLDKETLTLTVSSAQSWTADFWTFPPETLHLQGLSFLPLAYP